KVQWSDGLYRIYGLQPQEFEATLEAFLDRVVPDDRGQVHRTIQNALHDRGTFVSLERIIHTSGKVLVLESRGQVLVDDGGRPAKLVGVCRDVTEQHQHELTNAWQIAGFKLLAASAAKSLVSHDDQQWTSLFRAIANHLGCDGFTNYQLVDGTLHLVSIFGFDAETIAKLQRLALGEQMCGVCAARREFLYVPSDRLGDYPEGAALWKMGVRLFVGVPLIADNRLLGTLSFVSRSRTSLNESEREFVQAVGQLVAAAQAQKYYEMAIADSERRFRAIVENTADALILYDADGRVVDVNQQACDTLGYQRRELLEMHEQDMLTLSPYGCGSNVDAAVPTAPRLLEGSGRRRDGTDFPVEVRTNVIDYFGRSVTLAVVRDTSQRVEVERQKRMLEDQLRHSQKMEAVGRLAGGVAHDFNNLLTVINMYAELVRMSINQGTPDAESIDEIQDTVERAKGLTSQLLMFGRKSLNRQQPLDVNAVVERSERLLRRLIGEDIRLATNLSPNLSNVLADASHLDQVIVNLAVNARDAMPKGGQLHLETAQVHLSEVDATVLDVPPGEYVELSVADTGCGMDQEVCSKVFEPFFTTKQVGKGTGLGLSVAYGVVRDAGGAISVDSVPNVGSRFRILLPMTKQPVERCHEVAVLAAAAGNERILLVEDERIVREATSAALRLHGFDVSEASSAADAKQIVVDNDGEFALLLTDLVMPETSGFDLANDIRRHYPQIKILCISGYSEIVARDQCASYPFLLKPFTTQVLVDKVREVLDYRGLEDQGYDRIE
ncbi:MAG: PAS domain S-box protein, partial [Planctomycetales bacterium]|nr:PAS domain S-box protein [Planctomycetales bacterium]